VNSDYVHGYAPREAQRLSDQASTLAELLHHDTRYAPGTSLLEAGCGVGAQTVIVAAHNPTVSITSVDISAESVGRATDRCRSAGITNVIFEVADLCDLPYGDESFDHLLVCFVLEHLADPAETIRALLRVLKRGGTITVIEGDHGSAFFHPPSQAAQAAIACQVSLQAATGGDANIGRSLYPLLRSAGVAEVQVSPRYVYVDGSRPDLVDGFTRNTFTAMIEGVRQTALDAGIIDADTFDTGVSDLHRTAEPDGVFNYAFFKAVGRRPSVLTASDFDSAH
jgi:protein-L-isoaspartate O-methyltransferase